MASVMSEESPNAAKRANFSAISSNNSNGISKTNLIVKTGATKKLVIKNFRGKGSLDLDKLLNLFSAECERLNLEETFV